MSEEQKATKYIGRIKYTIQEQFVLHNVFSVNENHNLPLEA